MFRKKIQLGFALTCIAATGISLQVQARPNTGQPPKKQNLLKTAAGCDPAAASIDLDINNIRAKLMTGGDMWWDIGIGDARYEVPKGTKKNSLFAGSVWIGGFTEDKNLKVAAQTYRQDGNDYWPGPLNGADVTTATIDAAGCSDWDRFWKVDRLTINKFRELYRSGNIVATQSSDFETIWQWPARGNGAGGANSNTWKRATGTSGNYLTMDDNRNYAPFVDVGGLGNDPEIYNPELGDYPGDPLSGNILGDQYIWWVFNDKGNTKQQTKTEAIGIEVQASAFAFSSKDYLNDATFYNYRLINRSPNQLDSTYIATWTDADLGYYKDDYIGCDTVRGLGILYNGLAIDGQGEPTSYGSQVPMVGVDFFKGPKKVYTIPGTTRDTEVVLKMEAFTYYDNNSDARIGNPSNGIQIYNYMTGSTRNGQKFVNDYQGPGVTSKGLTQGPITRFMFFGEPNKNEWSECSCQNPVDDRRFIHSSGPFTLKSGAVNDITIGAVWVSDAGGCPNTSFKKIRAADDLAQALFDNNFKTIEGPEAPRMTKVELDRKIIFYLSNDPLSTNFREQYGYRVDSAKYRVAVVKAKKIGKADSLYKFEGYRVFQLKNSEVQAAQIFDEHGEVNTALAREVFQTDIQNSVTQLVNWEKNINIVGCDSCYTPVVKVAGKDSGIVHSFEISSDAFATGQNKNLVNYKTYYFVAVAYALNNFANFSPRNIEETQDVVYLESAHGAGGSAIPVVAAMPNPSNGNMGTDIGLTQYGTGVVIRKMEGIGNGGNVLQMTESSETEALFDPSYQSKQPTYVAGAGPIDVKVVNPLKVIPANWELYMIKDTNATGSWALDNGIPDTSRGLDSSKTAWMLVQDGDLAHPIIAERNIDVLNEQILEQYGISVSIKQVKRPGEDVDHGDGYITSTVSFKNAAYAWLAGVQDQEQRSLQNWIRSGSNSDPLPPLDPALPYQDCHFADNYMPNSPMDPNQNYESMLANNSFTRATWAPYALGATETNASCGFGIQNPNPRKSSLYDLQSVDIVFTSDKTKWSRCVVLEMNDADGALSENGARKFKLRGHRSWTGDVDASGAPVYASNALDTGFSYFPGYAISQETGERLNILFSEDSYLSNHNGRDMIWNPTSEVTDFTGNPIFGGKHYVYVSKFKYDGCDSMSKLLTHTSSIVQGNFFKSLIWTGMPTLAPGFKLLPLKDGLIPTETRLKFNVTRPYYKYVPNGLTPGYTLKNDGYPLYGFSTANLAPRNLGEAGNGMTAQGILDSIQVVPNPYYALAQGYEKNRLDQRVRITRLPHRATISVYSLDGSLIRRLDKDDDLSYIDWDIRNAKGLPIASGMYLIHVNAEGIGEAIIRWFGAMRPVDVTQY